MNWECPHCHISLELSGGIEFAFCPACGICTGNVKPEPAKPKEEPPAESVCPVCCSPILPDEAKLVCPDCKMAYHQDCWNDNNGCATYGCPSVGCLNPPPLKVDGKEAAGGATRKMVCPHCGIPRAPGAAFCWSCGRALTAKGKKPGEREEGNRELFHCIKHVGVRGFIRALPIRTRIAIIAYIAIIAIVANIVAVIALIIAACIIANFLRAL